jgi:hyaluronoglucosaminidase
MTPSTPAEASPAPVATPSAIHGVIEGFYGEPWTTKQRVAMMDFMGAHHFNTYVYAPKDDPYQRKQWSQPYPQANLREMQTLVETAARDGLHFVYSVSPGLPAPIQGEGTTQDDLNRSMTFSAPDDRDRLAAKIDQLRGIGVHEFLLSFDDVQESLKPADQSVYSTSLSAAHVSVANDLYQREKQLNPDFQLWLAPTSYYGLRDNPYWQTIRQQLHPAIPVIWTGKWVLNQTITSADAEQAAKWLGRKPLLWDNYPVNDYTYVVKKAPQLLLGPLEGRDTDLPNHLAGYIANPMIQPESSKVALATIGDYLHDPAAYQAGTSWKNALRSLDGIGDAGAWQLFSSYTQESTLRPVSNPDFAQMASEFWNTYTPPTEPTAASKNNASAEARLRQEFQNLTQLPATLRRTLHNPALLTEIDPWLSKLSNEASAGLAALDCLAAPADSPQKSALRQTLQARLQTAQSTNLKIGADILAFAQQAAAR